MMTPTDLALFLMATGEYGVREALAIAHTMTEADVLYFCYRCTEWQPLNHVHSIGH